MSEPRTKCPYCNGDGSIVLGTKMAVGLRVAMLRRQRELTQEGLAELLGATRASIANIEIGRCGLQMDRLIRLAEVFEVTTDHLLGREES